MVMEKKETMTNNATETFYAPPGREPADILKKEMETICNNPVIDGLMNTVSGFLAIINEQRQILAINRGFMEMLGISDPDIVFGLRLGEAIGCIHSSDMAAGCGTAEFCKSCGAAVAIVTSLGMDVPVERNCVVTIRKNQEEYDLFLKVQSCPITIRDARYLLLFLHDITRQQRWALLERVFLHDINNIVTGILGRSELLQYETETKRHESVREIYHLALRLAREIAIQRYLSLSEEAEYEVFVQNVSEKDILKEIKSLFSNHARSSGRKLLLPETSAGVMIKTDLLLLTRVLSNMMINALEASEEGDAIKVQVTSNQGYLKVGIWNRQVIPHHVATRIFQRNFSTKDEIGRGLGTYSMKLFGEQLLNGKVGFSSDDQNGTWFWISLPVLLQRI
jgi:signal transduction histidine kinase